MVELIRCAWVHGRSEDDPMLRYHDHEWGVPLHDDRSLFELLTLEGAQAGLSWDIVLRRREGYRNAFFDFDLERIAAFDAEDQARLVRDAAIIRNAAKIAATIKNARAAQELIASLGSLDAFFWSFVSGTPQQNGFTAMDQVPAKTPISEAMSKELSRLGFGFVGPTICYALMQSAGLVNDHTTDCFRHVELS